MQSYIYQALMFFRKLFSRNSAWLVFCMVILGFIGTHEMRGVTSFCRFWNLDTRGYHALLHFFRSSAWSLDALIVYWTTFVLSQNEAVFIQERVVLFGDHTCIPKDGRRMPSVVTLHEHSETQSKPSYFRGHSWGAIGMLIGSMAAPFCVPIALGIHQGLVHIGEKNKPQEKKGTLGTRIIQMAIDFAMRHDLPNLLVLDAFFPCADVFKLADSVWSVRSKRPLVTLIVRAKKNCVAYFEAEKPRIRKPGRPAVYGEKINLFELFDQLHFFSKMRCPVYGKIEEVSITSLNLLWKPTGKLIRFVIAITSRGPIVLMCSDIQQDPIAALELYCSRVRIEIMFDMLKNLMGAFRYRFWTKRLPRHSRKPGKNRNLKKPAQDQLSTVKLCFDAYERFVMTSAVSLGLLQLIALKYGSTVWNCFDGFLRTRSRELPSERTVKSVIRGLLIRDLLGFAPGAIMREILQRYCRKNTVYQRAYSTPESQKISIQC